MRIIRPKSFLDLDPNPTTQERQSRNWRLLKLLLTTQPAVQPAALPAPSGLHTTAVRSTRIDFAWTAPGAGEMVFRIIRSTDGVNWVQLADVLASVTAYSDTGLTPATTYFYRVRGVGVDSASAWSAVLSATTMAVEPGLLGEYYDGDGLGGGSAPFLARIDPAVDFNWDVDGPPGAPYPGSHGPGVPPQGYSVRWTGSVKPQYSETYTFRVNHDDGVKLYINGTLVIDQWSDGSGDHTGTITLIAGTWYSLELRYYANIHWTDPEHTILGSNLAHVYLKWSSPSQALQIIPEARLKAGPP